MPRLSAVAVLGLNGAAFRQRNHRLGRSGSLSADCGCPRGSSVPLRQVATRLPCPHLRQDWAHLCRTSAPGLGSLRPHLRHDWARPCHIFARSLFSETSRARISRSRSAETVSLRTLSLRWVAAAALAGSQHSAVTRGRDGWEACIQSFSVTDTAHPPCLRALVAFVNADMQEAGRAQEAAEGAHAPVHVHACRGGGVHATLLR